VIQHLNLIKVAFISYRRETDSETARLVRCELAVKGYMAFLDVPDLRSSYFDEHLLREIENVPNFVLVLSADSLKRCNQEGDWLRREIAHAITTKRRIIPIVKDDFIMPNMEDLPDDISELPRHNFVKYDHILFDATIKSLIEFINDINSHDRKAN